MEQTNLVVTSDGKSWDEVTRDTSYIGNGLIVATRDGGDQSGDGIFTFDYLRGFHHSTRFYNKDFAIAYGKYICLVDGTYNIDFYARGTNVERKLGYIYVNATYELFMENGEGGSDGKACILGNITINLKRGDTFHIYRDMGNWNGVDKNENLLHVTRV